MTIPGHYPASLLSKELADALDRSFNTTLRSRIALRQAVRGYAINKRQSGMTIDELCDAAGKILAEVENERADGTSATPFRDHELAKLLRKWCKEDYVSY